MNKLYDRQYWHNGTTPALNESNLNDLSQAVDEIDDRVVEIAGDVLEVVPQIQHYLEQAEDLVEAMETLSKNPPYIGDNGNWYVWDTDTSQYVDSGVDASLTITIADVTAIAPDATPYVTNTGTSTDPIFHLFIPRGVKGDDGISVTGVSLQSTSGKVKTYRMTFSDGTYFDYNVTDGADGSGTGDMTKSVYDSNDAVANAGGISAFVTGLINALATVARTGAYSDLTGLPTIPTVNNGTLTIQQNGTTKGRFDANQSRNETANIVTDEWSTSAQVSSGSVSFTIPSNTFGYDLYCERPNVSVTNVAVNGTTVTYTLSGAQNGDNCKLRILK